MKSVSEIIAEELKKNKINDIFMLTGYGAMYLNDAIKKKIFAILLQEMRLQHQ